MSTRQSPAAIRAFNYAIESIHDPESRTAFRSDHARALARGLSEFGVIKLCQHVAMTMALTDAMERAVAQGDSIEATALGLILMDRASCPGQ